MSNRRRADMPSNDSDLFPIIDKPDDIFFCLKPITIQNNDVLKFTDFTLFKPKNDGVAVGGFYHDKNHEGWLLKNGQEYKPVSIVKEYVAGGIYQLVLGNNAPQTEIVIDDLHSSLLIGSKLLDNFDTLSKYKDCSYSYLNYHPYGSDFPTTLNGKPVNGFMDAIWAIQFIKDTDAHGKNVGLIDKGEYFNFAKIDHGFSFSFNDFDKHATTLDDLRLHLKLFYNIESLENIGFDEIYQGLTHITTIDFSNIELLVKDKMDVVKTHMEILDLTELEGNYNCPHHGNLESNLAQYQDNLISNLKFDHHQLQKIADFMSLEKAIVDHDGSKLINLIDSGINLEEGFKPFYQPTFNEKNFWSMQTQSVTALELGQKYWPEVFNETNIDGLHSHTLSLSDVLGNTSAIAQIDNFVSIPLLAMPQLEIQPPCASVFA